MARAGDLPRRFAAVSPTSAVPVAAQIALAAAVVLLTALTDVGHAIGFSSFGVLLYYAIANAAAWTQDDRHRRWPRSIQVAGLVGCLVLAFTVPPLSVVGGAAVIAAGLVGRHAVGRRAPGG
jgi:APA family basic amino acid/polyamine antiporter